ncbi:MAG: hypothetical protein LUE89_07160 [Clostridiales bacterium]|nr:hypothetical protein [Clostridiales bacterium]
MKRVLSFVLCITLLICIVFPNQALAVEATFQGTNFENGVSYVETLTVDSTSRATGRSWTRSRDYYCSNQLIATIGITATFAYDGSTVSVTSKRVSQKVTYQGWSFSQTSFTSSGGTVRLKGKLKKAGNDDISVNLAITCDKNGNIS